MQATKAAPAVAIIGALVAAPHAFSTSAQSASATTQGHQTGAAHEGAQVETANLDSFTTSATPATFRKELWPICRVGPNMPPGYGGGNGGNGGWQPNPYPWNNPFQQAPPD
jgi:hypothetical protein